MKCIHHIPSPSSPPFPLPTTQVPHTHTVPILQSCLSLLVFKLVFKGVSQCMPTLGASLSWHEWPSMCWVLGMQKWGGMGLKGCLASCRLCTWQGWWEGPGGHTWELQYWVPPGRRRRSRCAWVWVRSVGSWIQHPAPSRCALNPVEGLKKRTYEWPSTAISLWVSLHLLGS
jgi:hypothetical protein